MPQPPTPPSTSTGRPAHLRGGPISDLRDALRDHDEWPSDNTRAHVIAVARRVVGEHDAAGAARLAALEEFDTGADAAQRRLPTWTADEAEVWLRNVAPRQGLGTDFDTLQQCYRRASERLAANTNRELLAYAGRILREAGRLP